MKRAGVISLLVLFTVVLSISSTAAETSGSSFVFTSSLQGLMPWGGIEYEYRIDHVAFGLSLEGNYIFDGNIIGSRSIVFLRGYFFPDFRTVNGFVGLNSGADIFYSLDYASMTFAIDSSITLGLEVRASSFVGRLEAGYSPVYLFGTGFIHSTIAKLGLGFSF